MPQVRVDAMPVTGAEVRLHIRLASPTPVAWKGNRLAGRKAVGDIAYAGAKGCWPTARSFCIARECR